MDVYFSGRQTYGFFFHALMTTEIGRWVRREKFIPRGSIQNHSVDSSRRDGPYVIFIQTDGGVHPDDADAWAPISDLPPHVKADVNSGRARIVIDESHESGSVQDIQRLTSVLDRESIHSRRNVMYLCQNRLITDSFAHLTVRHFDFFVMDALSRTNRALELSNSEDPLAQQFGHPITKTFLLCLNATPRYQRLVACAYLLHSGLERDSLISMPNLDYVKPIFESHDEWLSILDSSRLAFLGDAARDLAKRLPLVLDQTDRVGNQLAGTIPLDLYRRTIVSLVTETATHPYNVRITEKTAKALGLGHPYLVYSHPDSLKVVKDFGFSTFESLIDGSYDRNPDDVDRLGEVIIEVRRLRDAYRADPSSFLAQAWEEGEFNRSWARGGFFPRYAQKYLAPILEDLGGANLYLAESPSRDVAFLYPDQHLDWLMALRPKPCPVPLIPIGGKGDGSYMVPDDLDGIVACFSPGANDRKDFEDDLALHFGVKSHMCDFSSSVDTFRTPLLSGLQTFRKKWLDVGTDEDSVSLERWVQEEEPGGGDLILQMDIEGAEFRNLLATPLNVLLRFRIIVIEFHGLSPANAMLRDVLEKLRTHFECVHARANNCCGEFMLPGSEMNFPTLIEATFLRRDRFEGRHELFRPQIPHPHEIDANMPDKAPLFLNEAWLDEPRSLASEFKIVSAQKSYQERVISALSRELEAFQALVKLTEGRMVHPQVEVQGEGHEGLIDLAEGKPYELSSSHSGGSLRGLVERRSPYFFHTLKGRGESITIDLLGNCEVSRLVLENRTDMCLERAKSIVCLFDPSDGQGVAGVMIPDTGALVDPQSRKITVAFPPIRTRFVSLVVTDDEYLHLSAVRVFGSRHANRGTDR